MFALHMNTYFVHIVIFKAIWTGNRKDSRIVCASTLLVHGVLPREYMFSNVVFDSNKNKLIVE